MPALVLSSEPAGDALELEPQSPAVDSRSSSKGRAWTSEVAPGPRPEAPELADHFGELLRQLNVEYRRLAGELAELRGEPEPRDSALVVAPAPAVEPQPGVGKIRPGEKRYTSERTGRNGFFSSRASDMIRNVASEEDTPWVATRESGAPARMAMNFTFSAPASRTSLFTVNSKVADTGTEGSGTPEESDTGSQDEKDTREASKSQGRQFTAVGRMTQFMEEIARLKGMSASESSKPARSKSKRLSISSALNTAGIGTAADSKLVINPESSRFLQRWDVITCAALCFVAIVVPVHVAMLETTLNGFFVVSAAIDVIFLVDLVLQFFIMYQKRTDFGYALEHNHAAIIRHYVKTWFFIDLISIIPVDLITYTSRSQNMKSMRAVKIIRLSRLLKLARLVRAMRLMQRYEARASIPYGKLALIKFFLILLVITHWLACLWALTLQLVAKDDGLPRWIDSFKEQEENVTTKTEDTPWKLYITCLYFTSYTITSVGYGDIGPVNIVETIVATIMIVIAGISWAVVLGQVCGIVANLDSDEQLFRSRMDELNKMMEDRVIAPDMRRRLRSFFLSNKVAQRRARHRHVVLSMSPGLRGEVALEINRRWITKVNFLADIMKEASGHGPTSVMFMAFLVEVSLRLNTAVHAQSETFGLPQELYILSRGLVGQNNKIRQTGSVWGVDFVISDRRLLDPYEAFALTYCEVMTLRRKCFLEIVDKHGVGCPELKRRVRRMICWLAVQRGIWQEAYRRRRQQRSDVRRLMSSASSEDPIGVIWSAPLGDLNV